MSTSKTTSTTQAERTALELIENAPAIRAAIQEDVDQALALIKKDDHELIRVVLSHIIGGSTDKTLQIGYTLARALDGLAHVTVPEMWANGALVGAEEKAWDDGPRLAFQTNPARMRAAQISRKDIAAEWLSAGEGCQARLSDLTLGIVVDPRVWRYVPMLLAEGPSTFLRRLDVLCKERAAEGIVATGLAANTIASAAKIPAQAVELNGLGFRHPAVEQWRAKLKLPKATKYAEPKTKDRRPIPRDGVRRTMVPLWKQIERDTKGGTTLPRNYFRTLRNFCIATILLTSGTRRGTLTRAQIDDYDPTHEFPDGTVGPAILLDIDKQRREALRWKALPPALAPYMELYMQSANIHHQPGNWPLWTGDPYKAHPPEHPEAVPAPWKSVYRALTGDKAAHAKALKRKQDALASAMLDADASADEIKEALASMEPPTAGRAMFPKSRSDMANGHSPHLFRKFANNAFAQSAEMFLESRAGEEFRGAVTPFAAASSVLDHKIGDEDRLGYGVTKSPEHRELWSMRLAPIVFEIMVSDRGAPKGIDQAHVRQLKRERKELRERREDIFKMLSHVSQTATRERAQANAQMAKSKPKNANTMSVAEVLSWFSARNSELAAQLAEIEDRTNAQRADLERQLRAVTEQMAGKETELLEAQTTEVPLPEMEEKSHLGWMPDLVDDDIDDDEEPEEKSLDPVRHKLWPEEMARILNGGEGKSVVQIRRYMNPEYMAKTKRTENVPWTVADLTHPDPKERVVIVESERKRFINAKKIDRTKLTEVQRQQLTVLLAQELPPRPKS